MKTLPALVPLLVLALAVPGVLDARAGVGQWPQESTGPVVRDYGPVYDIPEPDLDTPLDLEWRALFEVARGAPEPGDLNPSIETVARFLNMHARAGVPVERLHAALVLHGTAGKDTLTHAAYRQRYGVDNPNLGLLQALAAAGVEIYLCGQTAAHRGLGRDELIAEVGVALSAMTAIGVLQDRGYRPVQYP